MRTGLQLPFHTNRSVGVSVVLDDVTICPVEEILIGM